MCHIPHFLDELKTSDLLPPLVIADILLIFNIADNTHIYAQRASKIQLSFGNDLLLCICAKLNRVKFDRNIGNTLAKIFWV